MSFFNLAFGSFGELPKISYRIISRNSTGALVEYSNGTQTFRANVVGLAASDNPKDPNLLPYLQRLVFFDFDTATRLAKLKPYNDYAQKVGDSFKGKIDQSLWDTIFSMTADPDKAYISEYPAWISDTKRYYGVSSAVNSVTYVAGKSAAEVADFFKTDVNDPLAKTPDEWFEKIWGERIRNAESQAKLYFGRSRATIDDWASLRQNADTSISDINKEIYDAYTAFNKRNAQKYSQDQMRLIRDTWVVKPLSNIALQDVNNVAKLIAPLATPEEKAMFQLRATNAFMEGIYYSPQANVNIFLPEFPDYNKDQTLVTIESQIDRRKPFLSSAGIVAYNDYLKAVTRFSNFWIGKGEFAWVTEKAPYPAPESWFEAKKVRLHEESTKLSNIQNDAFARLEAENNAAINAALKPLFDSVSSAQVTKIQTALSSQASSSGSSSGPISTNRIAELARLSQTNPSAFNQLKLSDKELSDVANYLGKEKSSGAGLGLLALLGLLFLKGK